MSHECGFPWTGTLQPCLECGRLWRLVVYSSGGMTWRTWEPAESVGANDQG